MLALIYAHTQIIGIVLWMVPTILMWIPLYKGSLNEFQHHKRWERLLLKFLCLIMSIAWPATGLILINDNKKELWYHITHRNQIKREKHADKYL